MQGREVLVVDDEKGIRALMKRRLTTMGYGVRTACNGMEALEVLSEQAFPIAIVDVRMPVMDGITLLNKIKEARPATEVIILTAYGTIDMAVQAMKAGAYDFLVKPVSRDRLENMLRRCEDYIARKALDGKLLPEDELQKKVAEMRLEEDDRRKREFETKLARYSLTLQECRVVELNLQGKTDKETGELLHISYHTVKQHMKNIFKKMKIHNRIQLITTLKG